MFEAKGLQRQDKAIKKIDQFQRQRAQYFIRDREQTAYTGLFLYWKIEPKADRAQDSVFIIQKVKAKVNYLLI